MTEVYDLYRAAIDGDADKVKELLDNGCSPNAIKPALEHRIFENVAIEMMGRGWWTDSKMDVLDLLIDAGLNLHYKDRFGGSLLAHVITYAGGPDSLDALEFGVSSKFELPHIIRLREVFDKIVALCPSFDYERRTMDGHVHAFEDALSNGILFWFEPHLPIMKKEDQELFKSLRLAMLFE